MPLNGYTTGQDVSIDINTSVGPLRLDKISDFKAKPVFKQHSVPLLNGPTDKFSVPDGWEGSFSLTRNNSTGDDYQAQLEDDYFNGISRTKSVITETIKESGGSSTYRYTGVNLNMTDAGDKTGDKTVTQQFTWTALRRIKV